MVRGVRPVRARRNVAATRAVDTASNTPTTTSTPVFTPADSPSGVNTPATSDNEDTKPELKEMVQEVRITRSRKRTMAVSGENDPSERAPKRRTVANRAYVAIEVQAEEPKVRNRVNCDEE